MFNYFKSLFSKKLITNVVNKDDRYILYTVSPFYKPYYAYIIDSKLDCSGVLWVQYKYLPTSTTTYSRPLEEFLRIYKLDV